MNCTNFRLPVIWAAFSLVFSVNISAEITLSVSELENKIKGGWLGKTAGVSIGAPTEYKGQGILVAGDLNLNPDMSGGYGQDDLYVQLTFVAAMDNKLGAAQGVFAATMQDYGEAFKNVSYGLAWGNKAAQDLLRGGTKPPYSGMWAGADHRHNQVCDAIDWQIECDWIGLMCPSMPNTAVRLNDSAGHVIGYSDGLYGGYFVTAMEALAFRLNDIHQIVKEALKVLPEQSDYYKTIADAVWFHDRHPEASYNDCWHFINQRWLTVNTITKCYERRECCDGVVGNYNIQASFNGAMIAIGLLYGDGDILKTIEYTIRGGQDSDCNPANAGAVLGTMLGYDKMPTQWKQSMEQNAGGTYSNSSYSYSKLISSSIERAKKCIVQMGGTVSGTSCTIKAEEPVSPLVWEKYGTDPVTLAANRVTAIPRADVQRCYAPFVVTFDASFSVGNGISSYEWKFDDGQSASGAVAQHEFGAGKHTVKLTVSSGASTHTDSVVVEGVDKGVAPLKKLGRPIASVWTGYTDAWLADWKNYGSRYYFDKINDDIYPTAGERRDGYDTDDGQAHNEAWFGYMFDHPFKFSALKYQFGVRTANAGVFESMKIQVYKDSSWRDVIGSSSTPSYASSAESFSTYTFTFDPAEGTGIRAVGKPMGNWTSCAELDVGGEVGKVAAPITYLAPRRTGNRNQGALAALHSGKSSCVKVFDLKGRIIPEQDAHEKAQWIGKRSVVGCHAVRASDGSTILEMNVGQ
jgi:hypothetical protein